MCVSFPFCKNIPSALSNRQGGGKEKKTEIKQKGEKERWQWCLFGSGAVSNEAEAHPVIVPAAASS